MDSLSINAEHSPLHSSEAEPSTGSPGVFDPTRMHTVNQTTGDLARCMRFLSQPGAVLSVDARIGTMGAQMPAYTPTDGEDHPEKHADPHQLSSQSPLPTVQHSCLRFPPLLPTSASTKPSLLAAHSLGDEHNSDNLPITPAPTVTVASAPELQLATPGDERSDLSALLRTSPTASSSAASSSAASSSSSAFTVVKTCKCLDPPDGPVLSPRATHGYTHTLLSTEPDFCALTSANSQEADIPPDCGGPRQFRRDSTSCVGFVAPSNFPCHATAVPAAPETLVTLLASETSSATASIDSDHLSPTTRCEHSTLLPVDGDAGPLHDVPHDNLLASSVAYGSTSALRGPVISEDHVNQDESPCSGRLPPSSLPDSQGSEFSLTASCDFVSVSNPEDSGACDDAAVVTCGSIGAGDVAMVAQTAVTTDVLASNFYDADESCLIPRTPVDEDMAFEPSASSPPSSSPPGLFSSPARSPFYSPPSSSPIGPPCYVKGHLPNQTIQYDDHPTQNSPLKRARVTNESFDTTTSSPECRPFKRVKTQSSPHAASPHPVRPTQASQAKQHKKLSAPFRSPVIKGPLVHGGLHAVYASGRAVAATPTYKLPFEEDTTEATAESNIRIANKDRTVRAAKQFKPPMQVTSPIALSGSSSAITTVSRIGTVPTIQALQGQVQTLKQAIKVKQSGDGGDDQVLEQLVEKWTAVGREVVWALWDYVKDLDPGTGGPTQGGWYADDEDGGEGLKRGFDSGWGYADDEPVRKKARIDEDAEQEDPQVVEHTVGVMLRRLGIDPDTLGWNEDEGDFVDA